MTPVPPVDLAAVILTALLNPAVIVVAFWMGRSADQWQKLPVAAFAAALAGSLLLYVAARLGLSGVDAASAAPRPASSSPSSCSAWSGPISAIASSAMTGDPVTVLRLWLVATTILLAALLVWAFAPVLLFFLAAHGRRLGCSRPS